MYLKIKYTLVFIFMVLAPSLIELTPFPYELIWCLTYGLILGNILVYAHKYQKRNEELVKIDSDLMTMEDQFIILKKRLLDK